MDSWTLEKLHLWKNQFFIYQAGLLSTIWLFLHTHDCSKEIVCVGSNFLRSLFLDVTCIQEIWQLSLQWLLIFLSVIFGSTVEFLFFLEFLNFHTKLIFSTILHPKKPIFTCQGPTVVLAKPQNTSMFRHTPRLPTFLWTHPHNVGVIFQGFF